jgi:hypothetical protein
MQTGMGTSRELQLGAAAEHLVIADLILQGWAAFLAPAGMPYDVLADNGERIYRLQVKATGGTMTRPHQIRPFYRFGLRRGKGGSRRITEGNADHFAFVALDQRKIAYLPSSALILPSGQMVMAVEMKSKAIQHPEGAGQRKMMDLTLGRFVEDYSEFRPGSEVVLPSARSERWRSDVTVDQVVQMKESGLSARAIARALNCSHPLVTHLLKQSQS